MAYLRDGELRSQRDRFGVALTLSALQIKINKCLRDRCECDVKALESKKTRNDECAVPAAMRDMVTCYSRALGHAPFNFHTCNTVTVLLKK